MTPAVHDVSRELGALANSLDDEADLARVQRVVEMLNDVLEDTRLSAHTGLGAALTSS